MKNIETAIREEARKLLTEKIVDLIIGYEKGTQPLRTRPCFVDKVEDIQKLVWNANCDVNLSKYVIGRNEKVGVVAKGCDARLLAVCIAENQIPKEKVVIIGVPCQGVIDRKKIESKLNDKEITDVTVKDDQIKVKGGEEELVLSKKDMTADSCLTCRHRNPPIFDVFIGEKVQEIKEDNEFTEILSLESKSTEERWNHFKSELSKCIRCYACRNVCSLCYCKMCFVDQTMPAWFGKTNDMSDTVIYHIIRAFHVAGRCVDCGACSRVCPMDINLRELVKKMQKIMKDRYGHDAGLSIDKKQPLGEFKMEDPQEFIK